jgi:hypothetical protein
MSNTKQKSFNVKTLLQNQTLTQGQCVKFGKIFECLIRDMAKLKNAKILYLENQDIYNTQSKTNKGKKDIDICFEYNDIMYYFESKINTALDSEKSKVTDKKIKDVVKFLKLNHPNKKIVSGIVTAWYEKEPKLVVTPKTKVYYMKDIFKILNILTDKQTYYQWMKDFGTQL